MRQTILSVHPFLILRLVFSIPGQHPVLVVRFCPLVRMVSLHLAWTRLLL